MWNPFRSKLAAAILGGIDKIHMMPGSKVLYLGAASGTTVSHVSDIVGPVSAIELAKANYRHKGAMPWVNGHLEMFSLNFFKFVCNPC